MHLKTALVLALVALPTAADLIAGDLDPTYGTDGRVAIAAMRGSQVVSLPGGASLFVGYTSGSGADQAAVHRFLPDGSLDTTFGVGGTFQFAGDSHAQGALLQPDGRIVVFGWSYDPVSDEDHSWIGRLHEDGAIDTTFGANGVVELPYDSGIGCAAIHPDGGVVAGTSVWSTTLLESVTHVLRLDAQGSLDTSFGTGGSVAINAQVGGADWPEAITVQPDGRIVLGVAKRPSQDTTVAVGRLTSAGVLDTTFGLAGWSVDLFPGNSTLADLELDADGRVLVAGSGTYGGALRATLACLLADGTVDLAFGEAGVARMSDASQGHGLSISAAGELLLAMAKLGPVQDARCGVARYLPDGVLDADFGGPWIDTGVTEGATDVVLQPDGKVLLLGNDYLGGACFYRLLAEPVWKDLGNGLAGSAGEPQLTGSGALLPDTAFSITVSNAAPQSLGLVLYGSSAIHAPFRGGTLVPLPQSYLGPFVTDATGSVTLPDTWRPEWSGETVFLQAWIAGPTAPEAAAASNGLKIQAP